MKRTLSLIVLGLLWAAPVLADVAPVPGCRCQIAGPDAVVPLGGAAVAALGVLTVILRRRRP